MRTPEQGLLTTADAASLVWKMDEFYEQAHGGRVELGRRCSGCKALWDALCEWIAAHAASEEELAELEAAREG
jgi:hypothetical protein